MNAIEETCNWLFSTREGVGTLLASGVIFFLIIAFVLERRGRKRYYDHTESKNDSS